MDKKIHRIWDDLAEIEVPENFVQATVGERRKVYGMGTDIPMHMLIDREKRMFISEVMQEETESDGRKTVEELAQLYNHTLKRNVPGYKCMGIYQRKIDEREACAIQYTYYAQELNRYTLLLIMKEQNQICLLNCVCSNAQVPQMHPVFLEILESINLKNKYLV